MVKLVWITPDAEALVAKIARVSNPENQDNPDYVGLLKYLTKHKHWSPFEMVSACFEIETSRRIAPQILRHRSFSFQEFSTRYSKVDGFVEVVPRRQSEKNRQSSIDDLDENTQAWFQDNKRKLESWAINFYNKAIEKGIAKETMAFMLPMSAKTKIYMTGNIRSWIHYVELRTMEDTQFEHRIIAETIKHELTEALPTIGKALGW